MTFLADLCELPYYAVIFSSVRTGKDPDGYSDTAARMLELASMMDGYLGVETLGTGSDGITVSYWRSQEDIAGWRNQMEHVEARREGRKSWYEDYRLRVAKVERAYGLPSGPS